VLEKLVKPAGANTSANELKDGKIQAEERRDFEDVDSPAADEVDDENSR